MFSLTEVFNLYSFFVCVCFLLWYYFTSTFDYWKKRQVTFKKPTPVFGNFSKFIFRIQTLHQFTQDTYNYFEDHQFGGLFVMRTPWLMIKDPDLVHAILVTDFSCFSERINNLFYPHKKLNPLSVNLVNDTGDRWKAIRKKIRTVFSPNKIKLMDSPIWSCLLNLNANIEEEMLKENAGQNMSVLYEKFTINFLASCAFGIDCHSMNKTEKIRIMGNVVTCPKFSQLLVLFMPKNLRSTFKLADFPEEVTSFYRQIVLDMVAYRRKNGIMANDLLQQLMGLQNASEDPEYANADSKNNILGCERFDEIDIVGNAFMFFLAFETVALTLIYCVYELSLNQSIQRKLRNEVETVCKEYDDVVSVDMLKDLKFLDAVVLETLRKYPPFPVLSRISAEDYRIPSTDKIIERGVGVIIPVWAIHHDEKYFPNPEQFDPTRFENKIKPRNGTFLHFGDGPRMCIGSQFAEAAMKIAIADAVKKYEFAPCSRTQIPIIYKKGVFTLNPSAELWVNIKKRCT